MSKKGIFELVEPYLPDAFKQIEEAGGTCGLVHPQYEGVGVYILNETPDPETLAQMMNTLSMMYGGSLFVKMEPKK